MPTRTPAEREAAEWRRILEISAFSGKGTQAKILEAELAKVRTGQDELLTGLFGLYGLMSQAYVGRHGMETFLRQLRSKPEAEQRKALDDFFEDPVSVLTRYALIDFVGTLASAGDLSSARFREINFADRREILTRTEVTTSFEIEARKQDVVWTVEAGQWRIADLKFAPTAQTAVAPPKPQPTQKAKPTEKAKPTSLMESVRTQE